MARTERNAPIVVQVSTIVLGYLAALTKEEPRMVMVNLRDLANATVERLQQKSHGYRTWSKVSYPGAHFQLKVKCTLGDNDVLRQTHWREREEACRAAMKELGLVYMRARYGSKRYNDAKVNNDKYYKARSEWMRDHPDPNHGYDYSALIVGFEIYGRTKLVSMTQDEIDTILVEDILLAPSQDEDDDAGEQ